MASKKGIAVTIIILAAITGASFLLWMIPEEKETTFVITNYEEYLNEVKNIHEILQESIHIEYQKMREGQISPEEYMTVTDITLEQTTSQISEFVTSKPPEEWQDSYINYMNSMMKFNEYIVETKVLADLIEKESNKEELDKVLEKMESLRSESEELVKISDQSRP